MNKDKNLNKKAEITAEEFLKIIISIIAILLLFSLATGMLYGFFNKTELRQAEATLNRINNALENLNEGGQKVDILLESPKGWYLISTEMGEWGTCEKEFCLCLCKHQTCKKDIVCIPTEKFVLLRNELREARVIEHNVPSTYSLIYKGEVTYPFCAVNNFEDVSSTSFMGTIGSEITPLFFRFNLEKDDMNWEWSPNLENWMDTQITQVRGGYWNSQYPHDKNRELISNFNSEIQRTNSEFDSKLLSLEVTENERKEYLKSEGINFLIDRGISDSMGVVILKKNEE